MVGKLVEKGAYHSRFVRPFTGPATRPWAAYTLPKAAPETAMRPLALALALLALSLPVQAGGLFSFCPFGGPPGWARRLSGHHHRWRPPPPPPPPARLLPPRPWSPARPCPPPAAGAAHTCR